MNKMKISDSDKRLLIIFFAIVILACSYFFIFNKSMSKASELEATNDEDRIKVQQMETMEAALPQVKENIETMKQTQEEIISKYPSDMKTEKVIETLQEIEEHSSDFHITDITFAMHMPILGQGSTTDASSDTMSDTAGDTTGDTESDAGSDVTSDTAGSTTGDTAGDTTGDTESDAGSDVTSDTAGSTTGDTAGDTAGSTTDDSTASASSVEGYYASVGIRYEASYAGLKEMIAYVNQFKDRTTIDQFSASFDDTTGKLTGEMTLNMYYLTNTGKDYVPPVFDFMPKGVNNIFGKTVAGSQSEEQ